MKNRYLIVSILFILVCMPMITYAGNFSTNCEKGTVYALNCTVTGGTIQAPPWWGKGSLWRIGPALNITFNLTGPIPNQFDIKVRHTGSWGNNEFTIGRIRVNGNFIVSNYIAPNQMDDADTFSIPRTYLHQGNNTIEISLSGGNFVWWIRSIEAKW
jgi:hypothetical protein